MNITEPTHSGVDGDIVKVDSKDWVIDGNNMVIYQYVWTSGGWLPMYMSGSSSTLIGDDNIEALDNMAANVSKLNTDDQEKEKARIESRIRSWATQQRLAEQHSVS